MFLLPFLKDFFYVYDCFASMYVYTPRASLGAHRDLKRILDALELELLMIVNHHVDARR